MFEELAKIDEYALKTLSKKLLIAYGCYREEVNNKRRLGEYMDELSVYRIRRWVENHN